MLMTNKKSEIRTKNIKKINLALEKICRNTGEDEYENIIDLESDANIHITYEKIEELSRRELWIWIIEPMDEDLQKHIEKKMMSYNLSISKYMKILKQDGIKYVKYPKKIEICAIYKDIFEILKEEHGIKSSDLSCYEWEHLQDTKLWKRAEIQIAREIIADKMIKHYFIYS